MNPQTFANLFIFSVFCGLPVAMVALGVVLGRSIERAGGFNAWAWGVLTRFIPMRFRER